jgi:hypothetical protein
MPKDDLRPTDLVKLLHMVTAFSLISKCFWIQIKYILFSVIEFLLKMGISVIQMLPVFAFH